MSGFDHSFEGRIEWLPFDRYAYIVIYLPPSVARRLAFDEHPRLRIVGEVADVPVEGAWQPAGDGRRYLLLSKRFLREAGVKVGDLVEVRFSVTDQGRVDVPDALADAISRNRALRLAWEKLTPGARRAFAHMVASAKREETVARRVVEVTRMVCEGVKPGAPASRQKAKRTQSRR